MAGKKKLKFPLEVYSVKVKGQVAVVKDARLETTKNGKTTMLRGLDAEGNKVTGFVSAEKADYWVSEGLVEDNRVSV